MHQMATKSYPYESIDDGDVESNSPLHRNGTFSTYKYITMALVGASILAVAVVSVSSYSGNYSFLTNFGLSIDSTTDVSSSSSSISFSMKRNGYNQLTYFPFDSSATLTYQFMDGIDGIIEPHADNYLVILNDNNDASVYYSYKICESAGSTCYEGVYSVSGVPSQSTSVNIPCNSFDKYLISIMEYDLTSGQPLASASGQLLCMYVRREIRSLTDDDLTRTMDSMFTMWSTSEVEGREKYGDDFHSSNYPLEFHFFNAAWRDSDHIHEGNGFIAQHVKMCNIVEKAMQSIDPSISLPYWDFTIESATNTSVLFSPMFTDNTFGSMPQPPDAYWGWTYSSSTMEDAAIPNGRWAKLTTDYNTKYDDLKFAYGYLRAPWNMNPSPYVTRFTSTNKHLPSCSSHYELLAYDDISDFLFEVPYGAHAATHGVIGGVYGCDAMDSLLGQGYLSSEDGQLNLCKNWIFYLKEFYRLNYITPDSNCTIVDDKMGREDLNCGFTCNANYTAEIYIHIKKILNSDYDCVPYDLDEDGWNAWYDFICTGDGYKVFGGDHLESASPADPSFWPIHPTLERVLQAKYMAGGFTSNDWPSNSTTEYVCDKASCYDEDSGEFGYWEACCYGHYEDDQLLDAPNGDRYSVTGWTNSAVMTATDAKSSAYAMPYIYDNFDWNHCTDVGLDFAALLEGTISSSSSSASQSTTTTTATTATEAVITPEDAVNNNDINNDMLVTDNITPSVGSDNTDSMLPDVPI